MAKTYATWNPADNTGTLSNGDLTWTQDSAVVNEYGKATIGKSSGKWYWEYTTGTSSAIMPGICLLSQAGLDYWQSATGYGYYSPNGGKYNNNSQTFYSTWQAGIIGVMLDMDAGTIELTQNGVSAGVQFSGLSGTFCPVIVSFSLNDNITANFGQSAFSYSVPSGYNSGLYDETTNNGMTVKALVVGGGGGGGSGRGGGGGGGGVLYDAALSVSAGANTVTVGTGGSGGTDWANPNATVGGNSVFSSLTSYGGGVGASEGSTQQVGGDGGNGGGGTAVSAVGGTATSGQGYNGGTGGDSPNYLAAGGGGGGGAGANATSSNGGNGGAGYTSSISGASVNYAGGGGGGGNSGTPGTGTDGGGNGQVSSGAAGTAGTANTGGGGGGGAGTATRGNGGNGGSGIVIISYATDGSDGISPSSTGGTVTTSGSQTIHTFTSSGTFTAVASGAVNNGAGMLAFFFS